MIQSKGSRSVCVKDIIVEKCRNLRMQEKKAGGKTYNSVNLRNVAHLRAS